MTKDLANARWRRSTRSVANGSCVELATDGRTWLAIRDSKDPAGPTLAVRHAALAGLLRMCTAA